MYKIYCDEYLLYTPLIEGLTLQDPKAQLELNKAGELNFSILATHPYFNQLNKLKSIITLVDDDEIIFRGRILNDETGFYNDKMVTCEGELGFLNDSTQRPYDFSGTPAELFTQFITNHNDQVEATKQFIVGNVTVTDPNDYIARSDTTYPNTWESINSKLIDTHGGYLWVRHEEDGNYIDYLADFSTLNTQKIETGVNLLSFKKTLKGEDIATAIIPLGAKLQDEEGNDTDERLTIESVNSGLDYITDQTAVATYGVISKVITWDDVTIAENLLSKATDYLATSINLEGSIEITALDLAAVGGDTSFRIGSYIKTDSPQHGIDDESFLIQKLELSISNPADNVLTLDGTFTTFTERIAQSASTIEKINKDYVPNAKMQDANRTLASLSQTTASQIEQLASQIATLVESISTTNTQTTQTIEQLTSQVQQNATSVTTTLTSLTTINDLLTGKVSFSELQKYLRFDEDYLHIGNNQSAFEVVVGPTEIAFMEGERKVAYISNQEFNFNQGVVAEYLRIGTFKVSYDAVTGFTIS